MMSLFDGISDMYNISFNKSELVELGHSADDLWVHVLDDFKKGQLTLDNPTTIVLLVLYVPIFFTSLIGNILVLLVIVPNQRMWTVTNNFLVNLAAADLLGMYKTKTTRGSSDCNSICTFHIPHNVFKLCTVNEMFWKK